MKLLLHYPIAVAEWNKTLIARRIMSKVPPSSSHSCFLSQRAPALNDIHAQKELAISNLCLGIPKRIIIGVKNCGALKVQSTHSWLDVSLNVLKLSFSLKMRTLKYESGAPTEAQLQVIVIDSKDEDRRGGGRREEDAPTSWKERKWGKEEEGIK